MATRGARQKRETVEPKGDRAMVALRLRPDLVPLLDAEGERRGWSRNRMIEYAVELWLRRLEASRKRRGKR